MAAPQKGMGGGYGKGGYSMGNSMGNTMGNTMPPIMYSSYEQNSMEMQRQMYGEQLYIMVQPLVPGAYIAQKITGMLLELPQNELMMNLTNPEEMHRRVQEA